MQLITRPMVCAAAAVSLLIRSGGLAGAQDAPIVLVNCTVVPMDVPRVLEGYSVVVQDGVIQAVGPASAIKVPAGARVIEAGGRYLMPGLADMHAHLWGNAPFLHLYLANGVTTVLELSGWSLYLEWRDEIAQGAREGPTMYVSTFFDGPQAGRLPQQVVRNAAQARDRVREAKEQGFDMLKVYSFLQRKPFEAVMDEAAEQGLIVIGHVPHAIGPHEAVQSGQVCVVHAEEFYNNYFLGHPEREVEIDDLVELLAELETVVIPNTSAIESMVRETTDIEKALSDPAVRYLPASQLGGWGPWLNGYLNRKPQEAFDRRVKKQLAWLQPFVRKLHEAGVLLLTGTDAAIPVLVPGFAIHKELDELVEIGLTPFEALACATRNPGLFIETHVDEEDLFGTVEVGMRADLLLLENNPLEDVRHVRDLSAVMARGRWYEKEELEDRLRAIRAEVADGNDFWLHLVRGEVEEAHELYQQVQTRDHGQRLFSQNDINAAGYYYLHKKNDAARAMRILELQTQAYPQSWNAFDSLGEAQAAAGHTEQAIASYERALELNPGQEHAEARLEKLRGERGGR